MIVADGSRPSLVVLLLLSLLLLPLPLVLSLLMMLLFLSPLDQVVMRSRNDEQVTQGYSRNKMGVLYRRSSRVSPRSEVRLRRQLPDYAH